MPSSSNPRRNPRPTENRSPEEPTVIRYSRKDGVVVLQVGSRREKFAQPLSPDQHMVAGDYHRARRGFGSDSQIAEILGVHRTRIAAWKSGRAPDAANAKLLSALAITVDELLRFLDPEVVPDWLTTEQFELQGTPMEALQQGRLAEVLQAANATEHGAYF
jgi:DNA-binding transcriptional regulator YiaG